MATNEPRNERPDGTAAPEESCIRVRGARIHNLRNVDADLPHRKLGVVTGVSGSGKSSLLLDTLYAEGHRRYVQSLSVFARQFLERKPKPPFDSISGLLPAVAITPVNPVTNSRSTVGTATELTDLFRLLYARVGDRFCECGRPVRADTPQSIYEDWAERFPGRTVLVGFSFGRAQDLETGAAFSQALDALRAAGFRRLCLKDGMGSFDRPGQDGELYDRIRREGPWPTRVVVDRLPVEPGRRASLLSSIKTALAAGGGLLSVWLEGEAGEPQVYTERIECPVCRRVYRPVTAQELSFNSPVGACEHCKGFGRSIEIDLDRVIPDPGKSLREGVIAPWTTPSARHWMSRLRKVAAERGIDLARPYRDLTEDQRALVLNGCRGYPGVYGFFRRLEKKIYRLHVRVFLSRYRKYVPCGRCNGTRLQPHALGVRVGGLSIDRMCALSVARAHAFFRELKFSPARQRVAAVIVREIDRRLASLLRMGLGYLDLDRLTRTLSAGEAQRIHLSCAVGGDLVDTLLVLDEPTVGLHPVDTERLMDLLVSLGRRGNTLLVIEHDPQVMRRADYILEMGPGAGEHGGRVIFCGPLPELLKKPAGISPTADYLNGPVVSRRASLRDPGKGPVLEVRGARQHNLRGVTARIPLGRLVCITGVSGAGKTTLAESVLYRGLRRLKGFPEPDCGAFDSMAGLEHVDEAVWVDASPIGKSVRSNAGTYLKIFDEIRTQFARLPQSRQHGLTAAHFSFNVPGGRCEDCEGLGFQTVSMQFLADVTYTCPVCNGARYHRDVLRVRFEGRTISEILDTPVSALMVSWGRFPRVARRLDALCRVGLGYLRLGQSSSTLSSGELQRLKLASFLLEERSRCLYLFDEPSAGLHGADVGTLLKAFGDLVAGGNTVVVVEHNLDIIGAADAIIDLGPGGGPEGGNVVAQGTCEEVAACPDSLTGRALKEYERARRRTAPGRQKGE